MVAKLLKQLVFLCTCYCKFSPVWVLHQRRSVWFSTDWRLVGRLHRETTHQNLIPQCSPVAPEPHLLSHYFYPLNPPQPSHTTHSTPPTPPPTPPTPLTAAVFQFDASSGGAFLAGTLRRSAAISCEKGLSFTCRAVSAALCFAPFVLACGCVSPQSCQRVCFLKRGQHTFLRSSP